jgi:hypothetical protein
MLTYADVCCVLYIVLHLLPMSAVLPLSMPDYCYCVSLLYCILGKKANAAACVRMPTSADVC